MIKKHICRICGHPDKGLPFVKWVKPTFTDHDKLHPGSIICDGCLFWFQERSLELAIRVGKEKPQRMRNYGHFIVNGDWTPLSKGDKAKMTEILLASPFPELAIIATSGQKHIAFRARRNPPGGTSGWIQFEEESLWLKPDRLEILLNPIENLMLGFSKAQIESGDYIPAYILKFGFAEWKSLEVQIAPHRGSKLFALAVFLAQKTPASSTPKPQESPPRKTKQLSLFQEEL